MIVPTITTNSAIIFYNFEGTFELRDKNIQLQISDQHRKPKGYKMWHSVFSEH